MSVQEGLEGMYLQGKNRCMDTIQQQASSLVIFTNCLARVALPICGHSLLLVAGITALQSKYYKVVPIFAAGTCTKGKAPE